MTPPAAGLSRRRRLAWVPAAAFVVLPLSLWAIVSVQSVLRERARNPYSRTQNGLTFIEQHTSDRQSTPRTPLNQIVQWLGSRFSHSGAYVTDTEFPCLEIALPKGTRTGQFPATARASNGDVFALGCDEWDTKTPASAAPHTWVRLPQPGVPATYQWLDITLDDKKGHRGTWRVFDLPRLQHVLLPTAALHETQTVGQVKLEARAWWNPSGGMPKTAGPGERSSLPVRAEIKATVPPSALSRPSQSWGVEIVSLTQEWDDAARTAPASQGGSGANGYFTGGASRQTSGAGNATAYAESAVAPYPSVQHVARVAARLTQYDTLREAVTFRNVPLEPDGKGWRIKVPPGGLFLTTPSGLRVALYVPHPLQTDDPMQTNEVRVAFGVEPPKGGLLPGSPLQQRSGNKPALRLSANVAYDPNGLSSMLSSTEAQDGSDNSASLLFKQPLTRPVLPELKIYVGQEVSLQSVPISFTVPVRAGVPKEVWER